MARVTFLCELAVFLLIVVCCASSLRIAGPLRPCVRVRCVRPCPYGYVTIRGCQTCQCKDMAAPSALVLHADGPIRPPVCGPICRKLCPNGFVLDRYGCPICTCKPTVCGPICRMYCPDGFVKDRRGCDVCRCNSFPRPCSQGLCVLSCLQGRPRPDGCSCPHCGRRDRDLYLP